MICPLLAEVGHGGKLQMAGMIRTKKEDSEQIPLDSPIWFMLTSIKDNRIESVAFQTSKSDLKTLAATIRSTNPNTLKVYGVWNGTWNTDLFDMDVKVLLKRIDSKLSK